MVDKLFKKILFLFFVLPMAYSFEDVEYIGEISYPKSKDYSIIAVDSVGRIYLGQNGQKILDVFNKFGSQIDTITLKGDSAFSKGGSIAVTNKGNIVAVDSGLNALTKYSTDGEIIFSNVEKGSVGGKFRAPGGVSVDDKGNIFVADTGNRRIQFFNDDGIYIGGILSGDKTGGDITAIRLTQHEVFTGKVIPKQPLLKSPLNVALDSDDYIYVLDILTRFIIIYNHKCEYMGNINLNDLRGIKDIQPRGLAVKDGTVFIVDKKNHNIKVLGRNGNLIQEFGQKGTGRGQFYNPSTVTLAANKFYVLDSGNNRVQIFRYGKDKDIKNQINQISGAKPKLAIFDIADNNKESKDRLIGNIIGEMLLTAFFHSSNFEIVERKEIKKVVEELNFNMSGFVAKDSAKEIGNVLGVDIGIVGSVSLIGGNFDIDIRLIDMKTGIVMSANNKLIEDEAKLRDKVSDIVLEIERAYLNRIGAPSSPSGIFAIPDTKSIFIKWNANPEEDVIGYNIFMKNPKQKDLKKIANVVKTEFNAINLEINTEYLFQITAIDSEGKESLQSEIVKLSTKRLPEFGYSINVKSQSLPKSIKFTWSYNEKEDVQSYQIFRSEKIDGDYKLVGSTTDKAFFENGLLDGVKYFYRIRKVYPSGLISNFSNTFMCQTDERPREVLTFIAESDLPRHVVLKWESNPIDDDIAKFEIYRSLQSNGIFELLKTISSFRKSFKDTNLNDNTTYYYKIKAVDKFGLESELSEQIFATTKDIPNTPSHFITMSGLPRKVALKWDYDMIYLGEVLFTVYRSESISGVFKEIAKTRNSNYIDDKLPDYQQYFYFITATDKDKLISNPSEIVEATTKPLPMVPSNLKAIDRQPRMVTLIWDKNSEPDIDHYKVYVSKKFDGGFKEIARVKETNFIDNNNNKGLKDNCSFYYLITANDVDGLESKKSEVVQSTTKALPDVPKNIVVVNNEQDGIVISWPPVPGEDIFGYIIYKNNSRMEIVKTNLYKDKNVEPGKKYIYQISAVDIDKLESYKSEKIKYLIPKSND